MEAVYREARLLMEGVLVGMILMAVYDGIRFFRFVVPHRNLVIGIEDLLYWIWSGLFCFLFLYQENHGTVRFYLIGSILGSMILYDRVVSRNLRKLLKLIIRCIRMKLRK